MVFTIPLMPTAMSVFVMADGPPQRVFEKATDLERRNHCR
jgi:hypothetical protein